MASLVGSHYTTKAFSFLAASKSGLGALDSDQPIAEIIREIGMDENTLPTWISQYNRPTADSNTLTDGRIYDELKRLKKENARLREERDLLKKAAYFTRKT